MNKDQYFQHDYNVASDLKISALIGKCGAAGYGVYWGLVEELHKADNHIDLKPYILDSIASRFKIERNDLNEIINVCVEYELFNLIENTLSCDRIQRNLDKRDEIKRQRSNAGKRSAETRKRLTQSDDELTSVEQPLTSVEQKSTKERERKENQIKSNQNEIKLNQKKQKTAHEKQIEFLVSKTKHLHSQLFPNQDLSNGKTAKWPDAFDKILRIDKRPYNQVLQLLEWVYDPLSWWGEHRAFRTPEKFRRKHKDGDQYYDIILTQYLTRPGRTIDDAFALEGRQDE